MGKRYLADKDHTHTATDVGAILNSLPLITDANTSIADSNPTGIKIERWSKTTLNTPYTQGLTTRSDGVVITSVIKGSFATQIAFPIGGRGLYIRPNIVGSIYAWSEYGDFKSDGSVAMTGTVLNMSNGEGSFENNGIDASIRVRSAANDDSNSTSLVLDNSFSTSPYRKLYLRDTVNGVNTDYKLYGEHNKPTASDVGAVGASELEILTDVDLNTLPLKSIKQVNISASADQSTLHTPRHELYGSTTTDWYVVETYGRVNRTVQIAHAVYNHARQSFIRYKHDDTWSSWKEFSGDGLGRTGSYTGNGSGTTREINVGGSGEVVAIRCGDLDTMVLAMKNGGGLAKKGTTMKALSNSQVGFGDGKIIIMTNDDVLNANGKTYKYQVL